MKKILVELDRMGVNYEIDKNPSQEKIDQIRKSIERRDKRIKELQDCFAKGGLDEVKKFLNNEK